MTQRRIEFKNELGSFFCTLFFKKDLTKEKIYVARAFENIFQEARAISKLPNIVKNKLFSIISDMEKEAIHICMAFIRWRRTNPPDVEALIQKNILPVRPDRKDTRKIKYKSAVSFIYRIA